MKVKRLKAAFDAGEIDLKDCFHDPHAIAGMFVVILFDCLFCGRGVRVVACVGGRVGVLCHAAQEFLEKMFLTPPPPFDFIRYQISSWWR